MAAPYREPPSRDQIFQMFFSWFTQKVVMLGGKKYRLHTLTIGKQMTMHLFREYDVSPVNV